MALRVVQDSKLVLVKRLHLETSRRTNRWWQLSTRYSRKTKYPQSLIWVKILLTVNSSWNYSMFYLTRLSICVCQQMHLLKPVSITGIKSIVSSASTTSNSSSFWSEAQWKHWLRERKLPQQKLSCALSSVLLAPSSSHSSTPACWDQFPMLLALRCSSISRTRLTCRQIRCSTSLKKSNRRLHNHREWQSPCLWIRGVRKTVITRTKTSAFKDLRSRRRSASLRKISRWRVTRLRFTTSFVMKPKQSSLKTKGKLLRCSKSSSLSPQTWCQHQITRLQQNRLTDRHQRRQRKESYASDDTKNH